MEFIPTGKTNVLVRKLEKSITEKELEDLFASCGKIQNCKLEKDEKYRSKCYGYVNYYDPKGAERAVRLLHQIEVKGKKICVVYHRTSKDLETLKQKEKEEKERLFFWDEKKIMMSEKNPQIGNIFIKNLDSAIDDKSLQETFSAFGKIRVCKVQHKKGSGGIGYILFENKESADKAIKEVNGMCLNNRRVTVEHFKKKKKSGVIDNTHFKKKKKHGVIDNTNFTNCYFKNVDKNIKCGQIVSIFQKYGEIQNLALSKTKEGKSKGFGWCNYKNHESAKKAVEEN